MILVCRPNIPPKTIIGAFLVMSIIVFIDFQTANREAMLMREELAKVKLKLQTSATVCSTQDPLLHKPTCAALLGGSMVAQNQAKRYMSQFPPLRTNKDQQILIDLLHCDDFVRSRGYAQLPGSAEEAEFPIAFSIMIHKDAWQAERLLRNIYQPQNHYCFHVDAKSESNILRIVLGLSKCLPNVFLVSKQESVVYASINRLRAELNCLQDLLWANPKKKWKYVINLTGQMFPLKTNYELVKILRIYNGANDIEGLSLWKSNAQNLLRRWKFKWQIQDGTMSITTTPNEPIPNGIKLVKGSAYGAFSREFVEYALTSNLTRRFLDWCADIYSPDEFYWATLHHTFVNPMFRSPGGYGGVPDRKPWLASYSTWRESGMCQGIIVRGICIFGVGDLPNLTSRKELFANKFHWDYDYLALDCLEEWLRNETKPPLDLYYYQRLPFIKKNIHNVI